MCMCNVYTNDILHNVSSSMVEGWRAPATVPAVRFNLKWKEQTLAHTLFSLIYCLLYLRKKYTKEKEREEKKILTTTINLISLPSFGVYHYFPLLFFLAVRVYVFKCVYKKPRQNFSFLFCTLSLCFLLSMPPIHKQTHLIFKERLFVYSVYNIAISSSSTSLYTLPVLYT